MQAHLKEQLVKALLDANIMRKIIARKYEHVFKCRFL